MGEIQIPNDPEWAWAYYAIYYGTGIKPPAAESDQLYAYANQLDQFASNLSNSLDGVNNYAKGVLGNVDGPTAEAFQNYAVNLAGDIPDQVALANNLSTGMREFGLNAEETEYEILLTLAQYVFDIFLLLSNPWTAPLVPEYIAAGQAVLRSIINAAKVAARQWNSWVRAAVALAREMIEEGLEEVAQTAAAQSISMIKGNRQSPEAKAFLISFLAGMGAGATGSGLHQLGKKFVPKFVDTSLGRGVVDGLSELPTEAIMSLVLGGGFNPGATFTSGFLMGSSQFAAKQFSENHSEHKPPDSSPDGPPKLDVNPPDPGPGPTGDSGLGGDGGTGEKDGGSENPPGTTEGAGNPPGSGEHGSNQQGGDGRSGPTEQQHGNAGDQRSEPTGQQHGNAGDDGQRNGQVNPPPGQQQHNGQAGSQHSPPVQPPPLTPQAAPPAAPPPSLSGHQQNHNQQPGDPQSPPPAAQQPPSRQQPPIQDQLGAPQPPAQQPPTQQGQPGSQPPPPQQQPPAQQPPATGQDQSGSEQPPPQHPPTQEQPGSQQPPVQQPPAQQPPAQQPPVQQPPAQQPPVQPPPVQDQTGSQQPPVQQDQPGSPQPSVQQPPAQQQPATAQDQPGSQQTPTQQPSAPPAQQPAAQQVPGQQAPGQQAPGQQPTAQQSGTQLPGPQQNSAPWHDGPPLEVDSPLGDGGNPQPDGSTYPTANETSSHSTSPGHETGPPVPAPAQPTGDQQNQPPPEQLPQEAAPQPIPPQSELDADSRDTETSQAGQQPPVRPGASTPDTEQHGAVAHSGQPAATEQGFASDPTPHVDQSHRQQVGTHSGTGVGESSQRPSRGDLDGGIPHQRGRIRQLPGHDVVERSAFEVRRGTVDGVAVTEATVNLEIDPAGLSPEEVSMVWRDVRAGVNQYFNQSDARLPSGDVLRVRVRPASPDSPAHHIVRLDPNASVDQNTWRPGMEPITYAHEVGHMLGLPDEHSGRPGAPQVTGTLMGDRVPYGSVDAPRTAGMPQRYVEVVAQHIGDVPSNTTSETEQHVDTRITAEINDDAPLMVSSAPPQTAPAPHVRELLRIGNDIIREVKREIRKGSANQMEALSRYGAEMANLLRDVRDPAHRRPVGDRRIQLGQSAYAAKALHVGNCAEFAALTFSLTNQRLGYNPGYRIVYVSVYGSYNNVSHDHAFVAVGRVDDPHSSYVAIDPWQVNAEARTMDQFNFNVTSLPRSIVHTTEFVPDGRNYVDIAKPYMDVDYYQNRMDSESEGLGPATLTGRPGIYHHVMAPSQPPPERDGSPMSIDRESPPPPRRRHYRHHRRHRRPPAPPQPMPPRATSETAPAARPHNERRDDGDADSRPLPLGEPPAAPGPPAPPEQASFAAGPQAAVEQNVQQAVRQNEQPQASLPQHNRRSHELPEYVRNGHGLGLLKPVRLDGTEQLNDQVRDTLGENGRADAAQITAALGADFESFLGDGRSFPATVDGEPGEIVITAHLDGERAGAPEQQDGQTASEVERQRSAESEQDGAQSAPLDLGGTVSVMGNPAGPLGMAGGTASVASPTNTATDSKTMSQRRTVRGEQGSAAERDVPVTFTVRVINHAEQARDGGRSTGTLRLSVPPSSRRPPAQTDRPLQDRAGERPWWRQARSLTPVTVHGTSRLFDAARAELGGSDGTPGSTARSELRRFTGTRNVLNELGAMRSDWVYSRNLGDGSRPGAVRMRVLSTGTPELVDTAAAMKLSQHNRSGQESGDSAAVRTGGDLQAGLGGGVWGTVIRATALWTAKIGFHRNRQAGRSNGSTVRSGAQAAGMTSLYRYHSTVQIQLPGGAPRTVQLDNYAFLNTAEAAELGLRVPQDAPESTVTGTQRPRYAPPHIHNGLSTGASTVTDFHGDEQLRSDVLDTLRRDPALAALLPDFDRDRTPTAQQLDNLRTVTEELAKSELESRMPSLTGAGLKVYLRHDGKAHTEYVRVNVRLRPRPDPRHLGKSDIVAPLAARTSATKLDSAQGAEHNWSTGPEGMLTAGSGLARFGPQGSLVYQHLSAHQNSGGIRSESQTSRKTDGDSHAFEQSYDLDFDVTRLTRNRINATVTESQPVAGPHRTARATIWLPEATTSTTPPADAPPGHGARLTGVRVSRIARPPDPASLLSTPRPAPRILDVETVLGSEQLRAAGDRVLVRAAGGDRSLVAPGSDAARRVDTMFSDEMIVSRFERMLRTAMIAPSLRKNRRIHRDRVGGLAMSTTLHNPQLVTVGDGVGVDRTLKGGVSAAAESKRSHGIATSFGVASVVGSSSTDHASGAGRLLGRWGKKWQRSDKHEVAGEAERTRSMPEDGRSLLVRWDMDVTVSAQSRSQFRFAKGSKTVAAEQVHLPGAAYVWISEDEARRHGLLADTTVTDGAGPADHRQPRPNQLPGPGRPGFIGTGFVSPTIDLTGMVDGLRDQLGELGQKLLPPSILNDGMQNSARLLELTDQDSVPALLDAAFDGGTPLLLPLPKTLHVQDYRVELTAAAVDEARFQHMAAADGSSQLTVSGKDTTTDSNGTVVNKGVILSVAPRGTPQPGNTASTGALGVGPAAEYNRSDTEGRAHEVSETHAAESSAGGVFAHYHLPTRFTLTVYRNNVALASATSGVRQLRIAMHADDTSTVDNPVVRTVGRPVRLELGDNPGQRIQHWQQGGGNPNAYTPPARFLPEGIIGAAQIRDAAQRALRAAGADSSFRDQAQGPGHGNANATTPLAIEANLSTMNSPLGWILPEWHSQNVLPHQKVSVTTYSRMSNTRFAGLSQATTMAFSNGLAADVADRSGQTGDATFNIGLPAVRGSEPQPTDGGMSAMGWGQLDTRGGVEHTDHQQQSIQDSATAKDELAAGRVISVDNDLDVLVVATVTDRVTGSSTTVAYEVTATGGTRLQLPEQQAPQRFRQLPPALLDAHQQLVERETQWQQAALRLRAGEHGLQDYGLGGRPIEPRTIEQAVRQAENALRRARIDNVDARTEARLAEQANVDAFDQAAATTGADPAELRAAFERAQTSAEALVRAQLRSQETADALTDAQRRHDQVAEQAAEARRLLAKQRIRHNRAVRAAQEWQAAKERYDRERAEFQRDNASRMPVAPPEPDRQHGSLVPGGVQPAESAEGIELSEFVRR